MGWLAPGIAVAEGAVKLIDCAVVRDCNAAGDCSAGAGRVSFRLEPEQLEAGGAGRYTIRYDAVVTAMQALSDVGPYAWTVGDERHVLVISSATQWLWHRLTTQPEPAARIRFLSCAFQQ